MVEINDIRRDVENVVKKYVENYIEQESICKTSLTDMGMDSLAFIHVVVEIEDLFGIEFPDEFLLRSELDTIQKMAEMVQKLLRSNK